MKKQLYLACFLPLILSCSCSTAPGERKDHPKQPNVIMILADDQGWGDLSVNGNSNIQTPHIDRLSESGASFEHFFVCAVCSPTRAEMLTGRYHPRGGVYSTSAGGERLDLDETTMGDVFKDAGYATAAFGKWHNGMQYPYHPNARGFDEFYGFCSGHWGNYFSPMLEHNGEMVQGNRYIIDDLTDHALAFMESHREQPFFLYLPYNIPHSPMQVPERWWKKFENTELKMRHRDPEKEDTLHTKAALAMCENIDWNVGRIMKKTGELGVSENTIILYFSDNGPNGWRWNGGMKGRKGSTDEGGVRSPLFIAWEGVIKPGSVIPQITGAIDLLPTLAELAGIDCRTNHPLDGRSLRPILTGTDEGWEERMLFNHWRGSTSVRTQQYRLDRENWLYHMEQDPGQNEDISSLLPDLRDSLIEAREAWKKEVLAERLQKDTRPFPLGHPDARYTQLPARDGKATGNIRRSNRYPNCSYFTHWTSPEDSIKWDVEVLSGGNYDVVLYYTCKAENVGAEIELGFGSSTLRTIVTEAHDPPPRGMENDRVERIESYVKDFKPLQMGSIHLRKGKGPLTITAPRIPGSEAIDLRLIMFEK